MDALNFMMDDYKLDKELRWRVRDYFRRCKPLIRRKSHNELTQRCLSHELRCDVRLRSASIAFNSVWWLASCEREALEQLAIRLRREAFAPKERILGEDCLVILIIGVAARNGSFISEGQHWGDIIVSSPHLRDTRVAKALCY